MKILHLSEKSGKGSAPGVHSQEVRRALRERGHEVSALDCSLTSRFAPRRLWESFLAALELSQQLRREPVELVYSRESWLDPFRTLCLRWHRVPWVIEVNGLILDDLRMDGARSWLLAISRWAQGLGLQAAAGVFAACAAWRDRLKSDYALSKIEVLQNGVFLNDFSGEKSDSNEIRTSLGLNEAHLILGYIGNLGRYYDFMPMLDCLSELVTEFPQLRLVLVGSGPWEKRLKDRVDALKLNPWVCFHGPVSHSEVPRWIRAFDLGWLPVSAGRVRETRGVLHAMKLAEYCAASKPVLRVDYEGSDSWAQLCECSWGIAPEGQDTLEVTRQALRQQRDWPRMGEAALQLAQERLSWDSTMSTLETQVARWLGSKS